MKQAILLIITALLITSSQMQQASNNMELLAVNNDRKVFADQINNAVLQDITELFKERLQKQFNSSDFAAVRIISAQDARTAGNALPLFLAALEGDLVRVSNLVSAYPESINLVDEYGNCILHYAIASGNENIVYLLVLNQESLLNTRNFEGETPIDFAQKVWGLHSSMYQLVEQLTQDAALTGS